MLRACHWQKSFASPASSTIWACRSCVRIFIEGIRRRSQRRLTPGFINGCEPVPGRNWATSPARASGLAVVSDLLTQLQHVCADLDRIGARYAIVGGLAVSLRTEPRFTRDLDVAVAVESDEQAEHIAHQLVTRGYQILAQSEQESQERLATVRLALPESTSIVVDLLFASTGIENELVNAAERIEALPGWNAPVARASHLLAMKLLSSDPKRRPQDLADAVSLVQAMDSVELDETKAALALITSRGFDRSRDLAAQFEQVLRDAQ